MKIGWYKRRWEEYASSPRFVFQAEVILFETTCRKPPSAGLFTHNIISISVFGVFAVELAVFP
ncbi:hypothetical protein ACTXT7_010267 [Hymenolepis weldensis]